MKLGHVLTTAVLAIGAAAQGQGQGQAAETAQQAFNAGQVAFEASDWATAVARYSAALRIINPHSPSAPVIRSRLATALWNQRQTAAARTTARAAVAGFDAAGITRHEELAAAYGVLGAIARFDFDDAAAVDAYTHAIAALPAGADQAEQIMSGRLGIALATMTSDPDAAARALDAVLADPGFAAMTKVQQADALALRARAELNRGNARAAAGFIDKALGLVGRTTTRVNLAQVRMRGDAALIYARLNDPEKVRLYLAYSGAGHLPNRAMLAWGDSALPVCGADVRPDDVAVVEFAINTDGRTVGAASVWTSRPGTVGAVFARAVRDWRWPPAQVSKLDPFWRASIRIEMRCVTRPPGINLTDGFRDATESWLAAGGVAVDLTDPALRPADLAGNPAPAARVIEALLAAIQPEAGTNWDAATVAVGGALDAADAPAAVRAYTLSRLAWAEGSDGRQQRSRTRSNARLNALVRALERRPDGARAAAWLRAEQAIGLERDGDWAGARVELARVTALPPATLPADDPVRTVAVLHQSMIDRRLGQGSAADGRLAAAGLDAESCSILDVQPVATNMSISSAAFPAEAVRWRFEGRVREAFDINADGSVAGVRTVIAYPPLVFGPATERAVARFRYVVPTLGDRPLGCVGQTINVRYVLPQ